MSQTNSRYQRSVSGLLGAILAVMVLILAFWGMARLVNRDVNVPAKTVDYTAWLDKAREQAPFEVLAPTRVPAGWRATSAKYSGAGPEVSWHLGFLTEDEDYVGLDQGNAGTDDFVADSTPADQPVGTVEIDGTVWGSLTSSDGGEQALVLEQDDTTTVVTGTADLDELTAFAGSLATG